MSRQKTERSIRWAAALRQIATELEQIQTRVGQLMREIEDDGRWTGPSHYNTQKKQLLANTVVRPPTRLTRARRRLNDIQVREIRRRYGAHETCTALGEEYGVSSTTINSIVRGYIYKDVK